MTRGWSFENSYAQLPAHFFVRCDPSPAKDPKLFIVNSKLALSLGLDPAKLDAAELSGNRIPEGAAPLAQAYAGHQFGYFNMLGDGRAHLLGEHITPGGERFDIQLKGSGQTPFSRRGDGRAALGPMLREYIISEAMAALQIPTTRSLAVLTTGERIARETFLPGAILVRVAASHIRVGTFEYLAARQRTEDIALLAKYALNRHYPQRANEENPALALLESVTERQAELIAQWMLIGFIHGVMNTDNMSIAGETIDYGPCAFMDQYDPDTVFSSIDHQGRYRYQNQPTIAQWNLARLAEALIPLLHPEQEQAIKIAEGILDKFEERYRSHWVNGMRRKLGLQKKHSDDRSLIDEWLKLLQESESDFTLSFRALHPTKPPEDERFSAWYARWQSRLQLEEATSEEIVRRLSLNPAIIPRNYLVEEALRAAQENDTKPLYRLLAALEKPYEQTGEPELYRTPPVQKFYQTFCGT